MGRLGNWKKLTQDISGRLLLADDEGFEEARQVWNARLVKTPAAILQCATATDAEKGVRFANAEGIALAVRGGGHSYAGLATGDDVLMIDFSKMKGVEVDTVNARVLVEAGVRWGELYDITLPYGLAPAGGTVGSVGVAGFTLGGGSGWMTRKHGLALDNLLSVELVTGNGRLIKAGPSENPDLFWGIRGGAGNVGIVTRFEFKLHPVPEKIFAGQVMYPMSAARKAMDVYREVMSSAPDAFNCYPATLRIPPIEAFPEELHGQVVIDFIMGHLGDIEEGEAVAKPLREVDTPIMDICTAQSFAELLQVFDAGTPPGQRWYSRSHYINGLTDEAIDVFLKHSAEMQGAFTFAYFEMLGGAAGRVDANATAFPHRDASCDYHILAGWPDEEEDATVMDWVRGFHAEMAQFSTGGVYVNLLAEDEPDRIKEAYGSNYEQLLELKRKWDPQNRLSGNQNISP